MTFDRTFDGSTRSTHLSSNPSRAWIHTRRSLLPFLPLHRPPRARLLDLPLVSQAPPPPAAQTTLTSFLRCRAARRTRAPPTLFGLPRGLRARLNPLNEVFDASRASAHRHEPVESIEIAPSPPRRRRRPSLVTVVPSRCPCRCHPCSTTVTRSTHRRAPARTAAAQGSTAPSAPIANIWLANIEPHNATPVV